jgi:hypothetical protein
MQHPLCFVDVSVHLRVDRQPVAFIGVQRAPFVKVQQLCTWANFFGCIHLVQFVVWCGPTFEWL